MCLYKSEVRNKVAQHDLVVYKWLERSGNQLVSPYYETPYVLGSTVTSKIGRAQWCQHTKRYEVYKGLHAYFSPHRMEYPHFINTNHVFVQCIIPKGSRYCLGERSNLWWMDSSGEIVCDTLIVGKKILTRKQINKLMYFELDEPEIIV